MSRHLKMRAIRPDEILAALPPGPYRCTRKIDGHYEERDGVPGELWAVPIEGSRERARDVQHCQAHDPSRLRWTPHSEGVVTLQTASDVAAFYRRHVDAGAEGIVVVAPSGTYKVKPVRTTDCAVIAMRMEDGRVRSLLLSLVRDGTYIVVCSCGSGIGESQSAEIATHIKPRECDVPLPEGFEPCIPFVVEVEHLDVIQGERMAISSCMNDATTVLFHSLYAPVFIRIRDDKTVSESDCGTDQIGMIESGIIKPKSTVIRREVWRKTMKGNVMVRKFMAWHTGLEAPRFVVAMTDWSPNRAEMLKRDVSLRDDDTGAIDALETMVSENTGKGWEKC